MCKKSFQSVIFPHPPSPIPHPLLLFILALAAQNLPAQQEQAAQKLAVRGKNFQLSLEASLGLLHGQAEELVFWEPGSERKLSQLLWDFKPTGYAGVALRLDWQKPASRWGFFTDGSVKFGFPGKSGIMEDRDWRGNDYPAWLTDYSVHDNRTESALLIDAALGASFRLTESFVLKAYFSYDFIRFAWTASGGSFLYPPPPGGTGHYPIEKLGVGDVGTYRQTWHIISPALALYWKFLPASDITFSLALSPLIFSNAIDNHLLRSLDIFFDLKGGLFIEPKLVFSWTPKDFLSLSLSASYRNISGIRGNAKYVQQAVGTTPASTKEYNDGFGAGYRAFDIAISVRFRRF
ncbi:MAG: omptin family outer membrane protease [Spirochaetaceae bacterium]|jgi:outer membrane protease|nr:omptin family outer membrane protease [Spirochaetaceae bacterium]